MCFIDLEMTDPDPRKARLAEIAVYLVSGDLRAREHLGTFTIFLETTHDKVLIDNDFVLDRFKKNGLYDEI
jgi:oligoribonuclease (3'-5' exoribonuclease)